jgi:hypothetical protein
MVLAALICVDALEEFEFGLYSVDLQIGLYDGTHYYAYEVRTTPKLYFHKLGRISAKHNGLIAGVVDFPHTFRLNGFFAPFGSEFEVPTKYFGGLTFEKRGG